MIRSIKCSRRKKNCYKACVLKSNNRGADALTAWFLLSDTQIKSICPQSTQLFEEASSCL